VGETSCVRRGAGIEFGAGIDHAASPDPALAATSTASKNAAISQALEKLASRNPVLRRAG
jgi:hypothetical protein